MTTFSFLTTIANSLMFFSLGRRGLTSAESPPELPLLVWSSTGGGWRSMAANMGAAHSFAKIGLFGAADGSSSRFNAISTTSGSSWFSLQFFFSEPFYKAVVGDASTPQSLGEFTKSWMKSYGSMQAAAFTNNSNAQPCEDDLSPLQQFGTALPLVELVDLCRLISDWNFIWPNFVYDMLNDTSTNYGDSNFISQPASFERKLPVLAKTSLHIQTSLLPNMRAKTEEVITYLGKTRPSKPNAFTVPLARQWSMQEDSDGWYTGGERSKVFPPGISYPIDTDEEFVGSAAYQNFPIYPPSSNDSRLLTTPAYSYQAETNISLAGEEVDMTEPFAGGIPTVTQIAAASSATVGYLSPALPSFFAQYFSVQSFLLSQSPELAKNSTLLEAVQQALVDVQNNLWESGLLSNLAMCGSWKEGEDVTNCGPTDVWFTDGGYSDGPSVALTLAQVQEEFDLALPIRLIISNNNYYTNNPNNILQYFNTSFNKGIEPGEFIWAPSLGMGPNINPWMSQQIFEEYIDSETLMASMKPISGTNLTTATLSATTIENPHFSIKAGMKVSIFLLQINSNIPTFVIGPDTTTQTPNIVSLVQTMANSTELQNRVKEFVDQTSPSSPTFAPTPSSSPKLVMPPPMGSLVSSFTIVPVLLMTILSFYI